MEIIELKTIPAVVDAERLDDLVRERYELRLFDVRTPAEYESAHIVGSYNVPLDKLGEHAAEISEDVDSPVSLTRRSTSAA